LTPLTLTPLNPGLRGPVTLLSPDRAKQLRDKYCCKLQTETSVR
jgi:hypothetical protein